MNWLLFLNQLCVVLLIVLLSWAAMTDVKRYTIGNWISITLLLLYIPFALTSPGEIAWRDDVLLTLSVFVVGFVLFTLRMIGGGDVKLLTAVTLWTGSDLFMPFITWVAILGGILAVAVVTVLVIQKWGRKKQVSIRKQKLPYGLAIAGGGYWVAWQLLVPIQFWMP